MGKARIDHSGAHNGIRSRKGRRSMAYGDLEAEIAHYSLKIVAFRADLEAARKAYEAALGPPLPEFDDLDMLPLRKLSNAVQSAAFASSDAHKMLLMLQQEKARRDRPRKLRKIGDISGR